MLWHGAAAVVGYLVGSLSFARIVTGIVRPGAEVPVLRTQLSTGESFEMDTVSATTVRVTLGTRWGVLTGLLDGLKVAVPTLILRRLRPGDASYATLAAAGVIGHNHPVYYGFKGGRGEAPIYGVMLAVDPVGVTVTTAVAAVLGQLAGSLLVLRWGGQMLLTPWFLFVRRSRPMAAFATFSTVAYFFALRRELRQYWGMIRRGTVPSEEEVATQLAMGSRLGRSYDRYSIRALLARRRSAGAGGEARPGPLADAATVGQR